MTDPDDFLTALTHDPHQPSTGMFQLMTIGNAYQLCLEVNEQGSSLKVLRTKDDQSRAEWLAHRDARQPSGGFSDSRENT